MRVEREEPGGMGRAPLAAVAWVALVAMLLVIAASAGAAQSGSGRVTLGGPNVTAYCQHLGFATARFTPPPNPQWECQSSTGSTAPVDMQAACEFSYPQRPIVAEQLTPGVLFTWQCLVSKSAAPGGVEVGSGSASTIARVRTALLRALAPRGNGARIRTLLRHAYYTMQAASLAPGTLRVSWSFQPKRVAGRPRPNAVTVAAGSATVTAGGSVTLRIRLTSAGKRMLKRATRVTLTASGSLAASSVGTVTGSRAITLAR